MGVRLKRGVGAVFGGAVAAAAVLGAIFIFSSKGDTGKQEPPPPPPAPDIYDVRCEAAGEKIKGAFQVAHGVEIQMKDSITFWTIADNTQTTVDSRNCSVTLRPAASQPAAGPK